MHAKPRVDDHTRRRVALLFLVVLVVLHQQRRAVRAVFRAEGADLRADVRK